MEPAPDVLNNLLHRAAIDLAFPYLANSLVDDFAPLRFRISVRAIVEAGYKPLGQERPIFLRQSQHFGHFFAAQRSCKLNIPVYACPGNRSCFWLLARMNLPVRFLEVGDGQAQVAFGVGERAWPGRS
jgi:hypothetical protein